MDMLASWTLLWLAAIDKMSHLDAFSTSSQIKPKPGDLWYFAMAGGLGGGGGQWGLCALTLEGSSPLWRTSGGSIHAVCLLATHVGPELQMLLADAPGAHTRVP